MMMMKKKNGWSRKLKFQAIKKAIAFYLQHIWSNDEINIVQFKHVKCQLNILAVAHAFMPATKKLINTEWAHWWMSKPSSAPKIEWMWPKKKRRKKLERRFCKGQTERTREVNRKSTHTHALTYTRKECDWKIAIRHCRWVECHRQLSLYRRTINMFLFFSPSLPFSLSFKCENSCDAYGTYMANIIRTYI